MQSVPRKSFARTALSALVLPADWTARHSGHPIQSCYPGAARRLTRAIQPSGLTHVVAKSRGC
jgi:hypothetical protein